MCLVQDLKVAEAARTAAEALKAREEAARESSRAAETQKPKEPAPNCTPPEVNP
jgi:hypothetical protein